MATGNNTLRFSQVDLLFNAELRSEQYRLILLLGDGFLHALVADTINKTCIGMEFHAWETSGDGALVTKAELTKILNASPVLNGYYSRVEIISGFACNTLVPSALYDPSSLKQYVQLEYGDDPSVKVLSDHVLAIEARNVYGFPDQLRDALIFKYPNLSIRHSGTVMIGSIFRLYRHQPLAQVFVQSFRQHFEFYVMEKGRLLMANHFPYQSEEELLYFIMSALEANGMDAESTPIHFSGRSTQRASFQALAQKYLGQTHAFSLPASLPVAPALQIGEATKEIFLYLSYLCV